MKSLFEQMGGTYTQCGDYLLPDFELPPQEERPIGIWGQRRREFLKSRRRVQYYNLRMKGMLYTHLADINEQAEQMDIENILNQYGRCRVTFECAPESYLDVGEEIKTFLEAGTLDNPTKYEALPEITIYGSAAGTVNIGGMSVEVLRITEPIILDSEMQDAYSKPGEGAAVNRNNDISAVDFPIILPGTTNISFSGGIEKIEIKPRWWEL